MVRPHLSVTKSQLLAQKSFSFACYQEIQKAVKITRANLQPSCQYKKTNKIGLFSTQLKLRVFAAFSRIDQTSSRTTTFRYI